MKTKRFSKRQVSADRKKPDSKNGDILFLRVTMLPQCR